MDPLGDIAREAVRLKAIQKPEELEELLALIGNPSSVLEIGSWYCGTLWAWAQVATDDALIVAIDNAADWRPEYARAQQDLHILSCDSHDPVTWEKVAKLTSRFDFIFIDGDHSYESVQTDYAFATKFASAGTIVAVHDILFHPHMLEVEVHKFWNTMRDVGPDDTSEIVHPPLNWGGIGVLRYG